MSGDSKVIKAREYNWQNIPRKAYKDEEGSRFKDVHRYTLLGKGEGEEHLNMETRYFEVKPGGYTSFEYHAHPHSVVIIRGSGEVILGDEIREIGIHDVVYIAPGTPHQFKATAEESLGFLCIVDRERDRPVIPDDSFIEDNIHSEKVRNQIQR